jgi:hypothetical protein
VEFFYNAKTLFYEMDLNDEPIKHPDTVGDNHGDLLHIGIRNGEYTICYYILVDEHQYEECVAGQKLLLNALNNGNIQPIESELDTENIFNQLGESIKRIIKEEMDEFEWAKESIKEYPYYRPEGRRPKVGEMIRIISKDNSWMGTITADAGGYQECFDNPNDITVTVNQVGIDWLEVSFWCPVGEYDAEFYVPFSTEPVGGFRGMDKYGIKIMPHIS